MLTVTPRVAPKDRTNKHTSPPSLAASDGGDVCLFVSSVFWSFVFVCAVVCFGLFCQAGGRTWGWKAEPLFSR